MWLGLVEHVDNNVVVVMKFCMPHVIQNLYCLCMFTQQMNCNNNLGLDFIPPPIQIPVF